MTIRAIESQCFGRLVLGETATIGVKPPITQRASMSDFDPPRPALWAGRPRYNAFAKPKPPGIRHGLELIPARLNIDTRHGPARPGHRSKRRVAD
jgi:hypothetical protein